MKIDLFSLDILRFGKNGIHKQPIYWLAAGLPPCRKLFLCGCFSSRQKGNTMFPTTNVLEYLERSAAAHPEKIAVADDLLSCTYEELLRDARRIGSGLCTRFSPRMPVAVFMEKSVETLKLFFGAVYAGCFY